MRELSLGYWDVLPASADNLRLFNPAKGWVQFADQVDGDGKTTSFGASRDIDLALSVAMNASNLMVLTGAGASFCARNPAKDALTAPGMGDLWNAVKGAATDKTFQEVIDLIPKAKATDTNIEKLLTQCKIYVELFDNADSATIKTFIETAEKAISTRVSFVSEDTDLKAHGMVIRKIARLTTILATQRPRDIPADVLSQLGTLVVHRLTNEEDRNAVEKACGDLDRNAALFIPTLAPGEAIIVGPDLPAPVPVLIHEPPSPPDSKGPKYTSYWASRQARAD